MEYYVTIAHWELPKINEINSGQYQISTLRQDLAPQHTKILLTARYRLYAGLSSLVIAYGNGRMDYGLNFTDDEMAMDSMFTHMAFQRPSGKVADVEFSERYGPVKKSTY
ncbi:MAG: hypothetical protein U5K00_16290 [Melioribacteraceae bacterium]|nr:hypothetical protein [Melioribacteraceae bacterium]